MRIAVTAAVLAAFFAGQAMAQAPAAPVSSKSSKPSKAAAAKPAPSQPAKPTLLHQALQGDAEAQFQLAQAYRSGSHGMKADSAQALSWFAIAAGNGIKEAAIELAKSYERGIGVAQDHTRAAHWWRQAALLGDDAAKQQFLDMFLAGSTKDLGGPQGAQWLETMVQNSLDSALTPTERRALIALGRAYEDGQGVAVDRDKARHWYRQAAYANDIDAQFQLGRMLLSAPPIWGLRYLDPARQVESPDDRIFTEQAAAIQAAGDDRIADLRRPGMVEAQMWLERAAHQGHVEAQYMLANAYLTGLELPFSLRDGMRWLSAAALNGYGQAVLDLATFSARGIGFMAPDPVRAWVNYDVAASLAFDGAAAERDRLQLTPRQLSRAKQVAQELKQ